MNHYKLLSLLLGVVAVADADYRTSKNFIHSVEFTICGNDPTVEGKPISGGALAEKGGLSVAFCENMRHGETGYETDAFANTVTVPGEVVVQAFQSTHRDAVALAAGGGIYLIGPYTLYVGDGAAVFDGSHEFPAGTDSQWTLPFVTRDTLGDESTWTMSSGYAVLTDTATGAVLSSIAWGDAAPASKELTIGTETVMVYPLVVSAAALTTDLYVKGDPMAVSGEGTWVVGDLSATTPGALNTDQVLSGGTGDETTDAPPAGGEGTTDGGGGITKTTTTTLGGEETTTAAESETGRGHTSKIGVFAVMGSMALVMSS
eukprot:Selendium_serpulae@DN5839_c0_g1_i6.p1